MKQILITIAAVLLVGCGESQQLTPAPEAEPTEPLAEAAKPEPPTVKAPDIDIHSAAIKGDIQAVKQHIAAGTDVNVKTDNGFTPLSIAVRFRHNEVAKLLLVNGAHVNVQDVNGSTSLDWAAYSGENKNKITDLLLKHGAKTAEELKSKEK